MVLGLILLKQSFTLVLPISLSLFMAVSMLLVQRKGEAKIDQWRPAVPIAILVTVLYGLDLVLRKMAVNFRTGIICFIWISLSVAALIVVSASLVSHTWSKQCLNKKNISFLIISGLLGYVLGTITFIWALELETVIYLAPFVSLTIPFGFIFSVSIIREGPTKKSTFGAMLFFSGVILAAL